MPNHCSWKMLAALFVACSCLIGRVQAQEVTTRIDRDPYLVVLGVAQDGGVPQAGNTGHPGWTDPAARRQVVCLALVDPQTGQRWLFEATPDLRSQLHTLDTLAPAAGTPGLDGMAMTCLEKGKSEDPTCRTWPK